jgi:predicted nucleic acid-binding protein
MTTGYLLDTNIAIAILIREKSVLDFIFETAQQKIPIYFSVITECEVLSGLRSEEVLEQIQLFNSSRCLEVTSAIANRAGSMRREQRNKGRKLKTPDALIIATALEHGLTLVSRDQDMKFVETQYQLPMKDIL